MTFVDAEDELSIVGPQKARTPSAAIDAAEVVRYSLDTSAEPLVGVAHIDIYAISGR